MNEAVTNTELLIYIWEFVKPIFGVIFTFLAMWIMYNIKKTQDKIDSFPEKYVMKVDHHRAVDKTDKMLLQLDQNLRKGLERIHTRLDEK